MDEKDANHTFSVCFFTFLYFQPSQLDHWHVRIIKRLLYCFILVSFQLIFTNRERIDYVYSILLIAIQNLCLNKINVQFLWNSIYICKYALKWCCKLQQIHWKAFEVTSMHLILSVLNSSSLHFLSVPTSYNYSERNSLFVIYVTKARAFVCIMLQYWLFFQGTHMPSYFHVFTFNLTPKTMSEFQS